MALHCGTFPCHRHALVKVPEVSCVFEPQYSVSGASCKVSRTEIQCCPYTEGNEWFGEEEHTEDPRLNTFKLGVYGRDLKPSACFVNGKTGDHHHFASINFNVAFMMSAVDIFFSIQVLKAQALFVRLRKNKTYICEKV